MLNKHIKCDECKKSSRELRFRSVRLTDFEKGKFVLAMPTCLTCSKKLVNQSEKFFRAIDFYNESIYGWRVLSLSLLSLILILSSLYAFIFVEGTFTVPYFYLFLAGGLFGFLISVNTARKYGI